MRPEELYQIEQIYMRYIRKNNAIYQKYREYYARRVVDVLLKTEAYKNKNLNDFY